jgi:transposase
MINDLCYTMQAAAANDYKELYEASQLRITKLESELAQLKKMIFGSRQERFVPLASNHPQLSLGIEPEPVAASAVSTQKISYTRTNVSVNQPPLLHPGRMKLPENLRREEITIEPEGDLRGCKIMGEEVTEVLEYAPGELYVKKYKRIKYVKPDNGVILIGSLPVRPLEKAMAGEGLLSQILIDKYVDHLPLHRQMQRFERAGVKIPYATLTGWVSETCKLITPLYEALKKEVVKTNYLHADETPIRVLDKDKPGASHKGYYWVYQNSIDKIVIFDYQEGRGREGPVKMLENFEGYLQTDGYQVYDHFDRRKDIRQIHCMAHARRKFSEAIGNDESAAGYALSEIQKLYAIERKCKEEGLLPDEIKTRRQEQSTPILEALGKWMKETYVHALPKSDIGEALAYSIKRWETLSRYTENGMLNIDNNPVENSIRPVALGRKNYLFAGSHEAAIRSGMLYSLFGTCKMHSIEPYAWLKNTLQKIPSHPINRIQELLPHRCVE